MTQFCSVSEFSTDNTIPQLRKRLTGECDLLTISKGFLLRKQAYYPRIYTSEDVSKLAAIDRGLTVRRAQLSLLNSAELRLKIKFSPNQPRVPAGQREGGQWTTDGGETPVGGSTTGDSGTGENTRRVDISSNPVASRSGSDTGGATAEPMGTGIEFVGSKNVVTIDYSRALTGISTIDNATKALSETMSLTMQDVDFIPEWTPQVYGTAVHVDFGIRVRNQGIPGIGPDDVEQSFNNKDPTVYGEPGSIRTDVVLRNDVGDIIAIYDVKTGGAMLTALRVRELREKTGVGPNVPIIELQVNRGATIKSRIVQRKHIGVVMALLWNPVHQGIVGRAAGA